MKLDCFSNFYTLSRLLKSVNMLILALNILLANPISSQSTGQFFQDADQFFKMFVKDGLVDYEAVKKDESLIFLVNHIASTNISGMEMPEKKAFYINAYNLLVIQSIIDEYPLKSVMDVKGFFDQKKHLVAGKMITLDQLEKELLFSLEQDPRFHFVLVCGAKGCPRIAPFAFLPDELENQLTIQTRKALNDPDFIRLNKKGVQISQIFQWYAKDFGRDLNEVISYINGYRESPIPENAKVGYYDYDWSLNEI